MLSSANIGRIVFTGYPADDFFYLNEEKNASDFPVSAKDKFLCTNVNTSSLKLD